MTPFKLITSVIISALLLGYFIYPRPNIEPVDPTQLPWHIDIDNDGNSTVFGLKINHSNLQDAFNVFGEADSMALYADANKPSIEVYFGHVQKAGLSAKVIITLQLSIEEAESLLSNAKSRMQSNSGSPKIEIYAADRHKALNMIIASMTYIPKYSGLNLDYLIDRFGTPSHQLKLNESALQLFYTSLGLSIISDSEGKEVFLYTTPSQLMIPAKAALYE